MIGGAITKTVRFSGRATEVTAPKFSLFNKGNVRGRWSTKTFVIGLVRVLNSSKLGAKATGTDMNNHKHFRAFALVLLLSVPLAACSTTDAVPKDYKGPLAQIADSVVKTGPSSANFFYVSTVNGRLIHESLRATKQSNYGQGFRMTTATIIRKVPAEPSTFSIVGRRDYAAPILALVRKVYEVKGETTFTPLPDRIYVVNGTLGDDYSAVWIEEAATGTVIGQKVEVKGSSTLGILEK